MITNDFKDYFTSIDSEEQAKVIDTLLSLSNKTISLSDNIDSKQVSCPHCKSLKVRANGTLKGVQRYLCNSCSKNFSETTGKFWYCLKKKDAINKYLYCLLSGYSIRKSAKETGISIQTSFDWRHKLLSSFSSVEVAEFEGIVESDDLVFPYSEKGSRRLDRPAKKRGRSNSKRGMGDDKVSVVATCDRTGNKDFKVVSKGRVSKKDIDKALKGKLEKSSILCTDSHRSYSAFAKSQDIEHRKFNASKGQKAVNKVYHVQNVNNMDSRLRKFMGSFNGVATKYLQNYLNWFLVLEKIKSSTNRVKTLTAIAFASNSVWWEYKDITLNNMFIRT